MRCTILQLEVDERDGKYRVHNYVGDDLQVTVKRQLGVMDFLTKLSLSVICMHAESVLLLLLSDEAFASVQQMQVNHGCIKT